MVKTVVLKPQVYTIQLYLTLTPWYADTLHGIIQEIWSRVNFAIKTACYSVKIFSDFSTQSCKLLT